MISRIVLLFSFLFTSIVLYSQKLEFTVTVKSGKSGLSHAVATIFENNKKVGIEGANSEGAILLKLDYNKKFRIVVEEIQHEPLIINVNSTLPKDKSKYTYLYGTTFEMVEKKPGYKPVYKKGSEMNIEYLSNKDNFGTKGSFEISYEYEPVKETPKQEQPIANNNNSKPDISTNKPVAEKPVSTDNPANNITPSNSPVATENPPVAEKPNEPQRLYPIEQEARNKKSKALLSDLEKEKEQNTDRELKNFVVKSRSRRTFLEEIADSKRSAKMIERGFGE